MEFDLELIEQYLYGNLSADQKIAFEKELSQNKDLRDTVAKYSSLFLTLENERTKHLERKLTEAQVELNTDKSVLIPWKKILFVLCAVGLAGFAIKNFYRSNEETAVPDRNTKIDEAVDIPSTRDTTPAVDTGGTGTPPNRDTMPRVGSVVMLDVDTVSIFMIEQSPRFSEAVMGSSTQEKEITRHIQTGVFGMKKMAEFGAKTGKIPVNSFNKVLHDFDFAIKGAEKSEDLRLLYQAKYYKAITLAFKDKKGAIELLEDVNINSRIISLQMEAQKALWTLKPSTVRMPKALYQKRLKE